MPVGDLDRSLPFYRDGLRLETTGVIATEVAGRPFFAWSTVVLCPELGFDVVARVQPMTGEYGGLSAASLTLLCWRSIAILMEKLLTALRMHRAWDRANGAE